jgi:hypothetical protein
LFLCLVVTSSSHHRRGTGIILTLSRSSHLRRTLVSQTTEKPLGRHAIDIRVLVLIGNLRNLVVARTTTLHAVEDEAEEDDEEYGAESCAKSDEDGDSSRVTGI